MERFYMHNSDKTEKTNIAFFKKTPVKVVISCLLFLCFAFLITFILHFPYARIYSDANQFQFVVIGASESLWGVNAELITEETGMKTCIYSSVLCDYPGKYELLKSVIGQDSVDLVVLDVSNSSLSIKEETQKEYYFIKVNGLLHKFDTLFRRFSFWDDEYDAAYSQILESGMEAWTAIFQGEYDALFNRHGYYPQTVGQLPYTVEETRTMKDSMEPDLSFDYTRLQGIKEIVELCKEYGKDIIVLTYPVAAQSNFIFSNWDRFHNVMTELTDALEVTYYDFNLLVDRWDYLPDEECFRDIEHLNSYGADIFSGMIADVVNCWKDGSAIPYEFYDSYAEAKEHSYYNN